MRPNTQETIDLIKAALNGPSNEALAKMWVAPGGATTGINFYDLEAPAKLLYPVLTPLRNITPRVSAIGGIQANWRAVTAIDPNMVPMGTSEGNRSGEMSQVTKDYMAVYRKLGLESSVTWEAQYSAEGFQNLLSLNSMQLLRATMIAEEFVLLNSFGTFGLGQCPQPAVASIGNVGSLATANSPYSVYCIALTPDGARRSNMTHGVVQDITKTSAGPYSNTDTVGGGSSKISAVRTFSITGAGNVTGSAVVTVAAVPGAVAYAWYLGASGNHAYLAAITTVNTYTFLTDPSQAPTTQDITTLDSASDHSQNALQFDGLIAQAVKALSGAYFYSCDGAALTPSGAGGISQIDAALQWFWDNLRLSPDCIWVSSQERKNINAKILTGSSTAAQRFVFDVQQGTLKGGVMVRGYLNPFTMSDDAEEIPIKLHPNLAPGTIVFTTFTLPYPMSNVTNVWQMKLRYDYMETQWPMLRTAREFGIYFDGVLQHYFPPSMGVISNIANA